MTPSYVASFYFFKFTFISVSHHEIINFINIRTREINGWVSQGDNKELINRNGSRYNIRGIAVAFVWAGIIIYGIGRNIQ